jgi:hypothetical protein
VNVGILSIFQSYQEAKPTSRPFVVTGDDDNLTVEDIRTTGIAFLGDDLVTRSACETFLSTGEFAGDEVEGLGVLLQTKSAKVVLGVSALFLKKTTRV